MPLARRRTTRTISSTSSRRRPSKPRTRSLSSVVAATRSTRTTTTAPRQYYARRLLAAGRGGKRSETAAADLTPSVRKHAALLCVLAKANNPRLTAKILATARQDPSLRKAVSECALNVLQGRARVSCHALAKLRRHRHKLRQLADARTSAKRKDALLMHGGAGFLLPLFTALVPAIGRALGGALFGGGGRRR